MEKKKYIEMAKGYLDGSLSQEDKKEFQDYLEDCKECRNELFKIRIKKIGWVKLSLLAASLVIVILLGLYFLGIAGNAGKASYDIGTSDSSITRQEEKTGIQNDTVVDSEDTVSSDALFDVSKIIYSGNISLYTDDYKKTVKEIEDYTSKIGGFIQNSSSNYIDKAKETMVNSGYIVIRVPADKFDETMKTIENMGNAINSGRSSTNITQRYQDIQGQLDNLKIQEQRLVDYISDAVNVQELLAIEKELNRVRTEIDSRTTMIKNWDKEIAYSTVYISIIEQEIATSKVKSPFSDMFEKIKEGFISSVNMILNLIAGFVVLIAKLLPYALIAGIILLVYWLIRKNRIKKK